MWFLQKEGLAYYVKKRPDYYYSRNLAPGAWKELYKGLPSDVFFDLHFIIGSNIKSERRIYVVYFDKEGKFIVYHSQDMDPENLDF
jgi:hypothetical protein